MSLLSNASAFRPDGQDRSRPTADIRSAPETGNSAPPCVIVHSGEKLTRGWVCRVDAMFEDVIESLGEMPLAVSNIYALSHTFGQPIRVVFVLSTGRRIMIQPDYLEEEVGGIGYLVATDDVPVDPAGYPKQSLSSANRIEKISLYVVSGCPYPARVVINMVGGLIEISADGFPYGVAYASGQAKAGTPQFDDAEYSAYE